MYWISIKTSWRDDADYMGCSRSARLSFHELVFLCARKETATLNMTPKQVAGMLGLSADEAESDINELLDAGLIERTDESQIFIPSIADEINKFLESRSATKSRVDKWRKEKAAKTPPNTDDTKACNALQTRYVTPDSSDVTRYVTPEGNDVTRYERTSKVKLSEVKDGEQPPKTPSEQKPPPAAESEFVNLWREWTLHTGSLSPAFKERIDEAVNDIDVWRDTLSFGAANRKIPHGGTGLDWALTNYKSGIAQKKALLAGKTNGSTGGRYADKIVPVEVNGTKVYYG